MADEIRGGHVPRPPDPGFDLFYYRNYNNDATDLVSCALTPSQPIMSITECGFTEQDGYRFKEWNTSPNGSATSYSVGDTAPSTSLFAIWEAEAVDVVISYKGSTIATMSASGIKTLETEGKYCEDDITVTYTKTAGYATTPETTITANPSISVSSGGLITTRVGESQSVTPTVSAGYVSSGTAGTITVSGSNSSQLPTQAAQTIHPSTTDQTIASGKYLTGTQTVKGVLLTNLSAGNIKKDVVVKVGDSTDDDCVTSVTGTYEGGGGGVEVDTCTINISTMSGSTIWATRIVDNTIVTSIVEPRYSNSYTIQDVVCGSYMRVRTASYILTGFSSTNGSSHVFENYTHNEHMIQVTTASTDTIRLRDDD